MELFAKYYYNDKIRTEERVRACVKENISAYKVSVRKPE
jgi:hypothetical protein